MLSAGRIRRLVFVHVQHNRRVAQPARQHGEHIGRTQQRCYKHRVNSVIEHPLPTRRIKQLDGAGAHPPFPRPAGSRQPRPPMSAVSRDALTHRAMRAAVKTFQAENVQCPRGHIDPSLVGEQTASIASVRIISQRARLIVYAKDAARGRNQMSSPRSRGGRGVEIYAMTRSRAPVQTFMSGRLPVDAWREHCCRHPRQFSSAASPSRTTVKKSWQQNNHFARS